MGSEMCIRDRFNSDFWGSFSKPIYSATCLIQHALKEQFCIGIVSVSDYTVQKVNRKTVKRPGHINQHRIKEGASYIGVGSDRFYCIIGG